MTDTTANPSAAPTAGGATTFASRFGGTTLMAKALKLVANLGRAMTGFAYRRLRDLEHERMDAHESDGRQGSAGSPSRTAGAPAPGELH